MELFVHETGDAVLVYRPLLPLAFLGNRSLAEDASRAAADGSLAGLPEESAAFLDACGFLRPDRPPAPPGGDPWAPTTAVLLLTNRCQLRCTYCYADAGVRTPRDLPLDLALTAVDVVAGNAAASGRGSFEVCFHGGGEPLLAWGVAREAARHARAQAVPARLTAVSNGVWTPGQLAWVLDTLDAVTVSCDGAPATQDAHRPRASGAGSSEAVLATLKALDAAGFPYAVRLTASGPDTLAEDVRFLCEHTGCSEFQVEPAFAEGRGEHRATEPDQADAFAASFLAAHDIAAAAGRHLGFSAARPWLAAASFCTAPYDALVVAPDGAALACYEVADEGHWLRPAATLGRLAPGRLDADEASRRGLHALLDGRRADECASCFCRYHCAGDCLARALAPGAAGPRWTSHRCAMIRAITLGLLLRLIEDAGGLVWAGSPPREAVS